MHRTQIYLTEDQHEELKSLAEKLGQKQSELIRQALDNYLEKQRTKGWQSAVDDVAGIWADRENIREEMAEVRKELTRDVWNG